MWLSDFKLQMLREHLGGEFFYDSNEALAEAEGDEAEASDDVEPEVEPSPATRSAISDVVAYRWSKGRHQWQVRWREGAELSWEYWSVLDSSALRERAEALRGESEM